MIGCSLQEKCLIIESDDWGSIRMSSKRSYASLKNAGINLGKGESERYNKFDTLASTSDLDALFSVLQSIKNKYGEHPKLTAVSLVANPDFKKIEESGFSDYYWETLPVTFKRYENSRALDLWKQGMDEKLFHPEFHGREHLNIGAWMRALQANDKEARMAFKQGIWGFKRKNSGVNYQAAFDLELPIDLAEQANTIKEGLFEFERLHGFKSRFFVPPNGPFNNQLQKVAFENGIRYLSTAKIQLEPMGDGKYERRFHYIGQKSKSGLIYLTRNAFFEPSAEGKDWVDSCLSEIENAFKWRKPAVISSHRVNFVGVHYEKNRIEGLKQLAQLLQRVVKRWPDIRFMTSTELGDLISIG